MNKKLSFRSIFKLPILGYQYLISPFLGKNCRFYPSCSHYALLAFETWNPFYALLLTLQRILRCNQFFPGGTDLVPSPLCSHCFHLPELYGEMVRLIPLKQEDFESLYQVAKDPKIWEFHPNQDRYKKEVFKRFFDKAIESKGAYLIYDKNSGEILGSSRYYDYQHEASSIVIGFTFFARKTWGQGFNKETKKLMILHAQKYVKNIYFHVDPSNLVSQKALLKLGITPIAKKSNKIIFKVRDTFSEHASI